MADSYEPFDSGYSARTWDRHINMGQRYGAGRMGPAIYFHAARRSGKSRLMELIREQVPGTDINGVYMAMQPIDWPEIIAQARKRAAVEDPHEGLPFLFLNQREYDAFQEFLTGDTRVVITQPIPKRAN